MPELTFYCWRREFGGMGADKPRRLKELEEEGDRLRKADIDLTLDKLILNDAAMEDFYALRASVRASIASGKISASSNDGRAGRSASIASPSAISRRAAHIRRA